MPIEQNESKIVKVKIADYKIAASPHVLVTNGLGSCVGLALLDEEKRIGALAHIMLPKGTGNLGPQFYPRYADKAVDLILSELVDEGCRLESLIAKLAGGASMFAGIKKDSIGVGERNVEAILDILAAQKIPVRGTDTGGDYGRSIEFHTATGLMIVRSIRHGVINL